MIGARIASALLLAPLAIAAIVWLPTPIMAALVAVILLLGLWEWTHLAGLTSPAARMTWLTGNAAAMAALAWFGWPHLAPGVVLLGGVWWLMAAVWLWRCRACVQDTRNNRLFKLIAGVFSMIPAWVALALLHSGDVHGGRWALFALALVWLTDIGAFLVGSRIGRRKLAPQISPNKTWEGFWGGLAAAALLAPAALPLLGLDWSRLPALLALALVTALFAALGDLLESLLKRQAGIKDSGDLIPGHGGVLDRIDSLLAALPAFVLAKLWLQL